MSAQSCVGARTVTTAELTRQTQNLETPWEAPACQRLSHDLSDYIFTAVAEKVISHDSQLLLDGTCVKTLLQTVTLRRMENFRGDIPSSLIAEAGDINGFYFKTGQRYLVFASKGPDGHFVVKQSSQTRALKDASADVLYLRALPHLVTTGQIFGQAFRGAKAVDEVRLMVPRMDPMTGALVTLTGAARRETVVNRTGMYRFSDLLPGEYTVEVHTGPNVMGGAQRVVSIPPKGCALVNFAEYPNNPELMR